MNESVLSSGLGKVVDIPERFLTQSNAVFCNMENLFMYRNFSSAYDYHNLWRSDVYFCGTPLSWYNHEGNSRVYYNEKLHYLLKFCWNLRRN